MRPPWQSASVRGMKPVETPEALDPETVDALTTVRAWSQAFNARDVDALLALAASDIRLQGPRGAEHGHDAVRRMVDRQSYGVAQHIRPLSYLARRATVAVRALVELRWVENGELADSTEAVGVFEVRDGRIHRFSAQADLIAACRVAGWAEGPLAPTSHIDPQLGGRTT